MIGVRKVGAIAHQAAAEGESAAAAAETEAAWIHGWDFEARGQRNNLVEVPEGKITKDECVGLTLGDRGESCVKIAVTSTLHHDHLQPKRTPRCNHRTGLLLVRNKC